MIEHGFLKRVILGNNKNENFKCLNFKGKCFIFDPLPRDRKPIFKILPNFCHKSDQIYHIWKGPLGDPLIILPSILDNNNHKRNECDNTIHLDAARLPDISKRSIGTMCLKGFPFRFA